MDRIRQKATIRILFSQHAIRQMSRPERMISTAEIRRVIDEGEIIEDYPRDPRGHSSLVLGRGAAERPLHVLCGLKDEYLVIITAYIPDADEWAKDYRVRKRV